MRLEPHWWKWASFTTRDVATKNGQWRQNGQPLQMQTQSGIKASSTFFFPHSFLVRDFQHNLGTVARCTKGGKSALGSSSLSGVQVRFQSAPLFIRWSQFLACPVLVKRDCPASVSGHMKAGYARLLRSTMARRGNNRAY